MNVDDFVWLPSYPRSGNTFLRTIMWNAFGLRSASVYPNDLSGNTQLEGYVGHVEHGPQMMEQLYEAGIPLVKTHEHANDHRPAIYVLRDGRAACVSLWEFYNRTVPLRDVIEGNHRFGTWSAHAESWHPWDRPNTLFLRYENMRDDLSSTLDLISGFLDIEIRSRSLPDRNTIAGDDGVYVRKKSDWRDHLSGEDLQRFIEVNELVLKKTGYI